MKRRWFGGTKVHFDHKFIHACELKYRFSLIEAIGVLAPFGVLFAVMYGIAHVVVAIYMYVIRHYLRLTPEHAHVYVILGTVLPVAAYFPIFLFALPWCMRVRLWLLRRKGAPICVYCSYDMSSIDTLTCPECGHVHSRVT